MAAAVGYVHVDEKSRYSISEELKPLKLGVVIATYPKSILLLTLSISVVLGSFLFLPSMGLPSIDLGYKQFRIDKSPVTLHLDTIDSLSDSMYSSLINQPDHGGIVLNGKNRLSKPLSNAKFKVQKPIESPISSTHQANVLNDSLIYSLVGLARMGDRDFTIQSTDERTIDSGIALLVVFVAQHSNNILTRDLLQQVRVLENMIMAYPGWTSFCHLESSGNRQCARPDSAINYYYPSLDTTTMTVKFDGRGTSIVDNVQQVTNGLLQTNHTELLDRSFSSHNPRSQRLVSRFRVGCPLPGFDSCYDRPSEQRRLANAFVDTYETPLHKASTASIRVLYGGGDIIANQVEAALLSDILLATGSFSFVFAYSWFHTGSFFLSLLGIFGILLAFPPSIMALVAIFGSEMSFLNAVSLWAIVGIGVDDIFVFTDMWTSMPKHDLLHRKLTLQLRVSWTIRKAGTAMASTSLTTALAFFANMVSKIPPIRQFGFFLGTLVTLNYLFVMTWFAAVVCVNELWSRQLDACYERFLGRCRRRNKQAKRHQQQSDLRKRWRRAIRSLIRITKQIPLDEARRRLLPPPIEDDTKWFFQPKPTTKSRCMEKWHTIVHKLRWVIIIGSIAALVGISLQIQRLEAPTELPQLFPSDSNIEQLRHLDKYVNINNQGIGTTSKGGTSGNYPTCPITGCDVVSIGTTNSSSYLNGALFPVPVPNPSNLAYVTAVPSMPLNVISVATAYNKIVVRWTKPDYVPSPINYYAIAVSSTNEASWAFPASQTPGATPTEYVVSGLQGSTKYTFRVIAHNDIGFGLVSSATNTTTFAAVPGVPTITGYTQLSTTAVQLNWQAPADTGAAPISQYVVESDHTRTSQVSFYSVYRGNALTATIDVACGGDTYNVRVTAVNSLGSSPSSALTSITNPVAVASVPRNVTVTPSFFSMEVRFLAVTCSNGATVTTYRIEQSTDNTTFVLASLVGAPGTWPVWSLSANTLYYWRVYAVTAQGNGVAAYVKGQTLPAVPNPPTLTALVPQSESSLVLSFTPPTNIGAAPILSYMIEWVLEGWDWDSENTSQAVMDVVGTSSSYSFSITNLGRGTVYQARVLSQNAYGTSDPSQMLVNKTFPGIPQPPAPPSTGFNPTGYSSAMVYVPPPSSVYPFPTLRLSWSEPDDDGGDDIISFELRVWTPPSDDTPININSTSPVNTVYTGPALHYTVTFRYGPTFYAFLRARNSYQWSAWSSPTSFQLSFSPETPVLSTFGISPSGFSGMFIGLLCLTYCAAVQWTAPYDNGAPITGYEFSTIDCHGRQPLFTNALASSVSTYTVQALSPNQTICLCVGAINNDGMSPCLTPLSITTLSAGSLDIRDSRDPFQAISNDVVSVAYSSSTTSLSLAVMNNGSAALSVTSVSVSPSAQSWVSVAPSSFSLIRGQSTTIQVTFLPPSVAMFNFLLSFTHNGFPGPITSISFRVIVTSPVIAVASSPVIVFAYANQPLTSSKQVAIQNNGTDNLVISSIVITPTSSWLTVSPTSFTIVGGGSTFINLVVAAHLSLTPGNYTSQVQLNHNRVATGAISTIITAFISVLQVSSSITVDGATQTLLRSSQSSIICTIHISSTGFDLLLVSSVIATGGLVGQISTSFPLMVQSNSPVAVTVTFPMPPAGSYTGDIIVTHNAPVPGSSTAMPFSFEVQSPQFSLSATSISASVDFGIGNTQSQVLAITNLGSSDLHVTLFSSRVSWLSWLPSSVIVTIPSQSNYNVTILMNPAAVGVGSYSTALVLQHDALPSLTNVSVSVSFSINSADLSISVPAISFASPFSLDATLVANVLINSNGTLPLQLLGISVTDSSWLMASFVDLTLHSSATASLLSGSSITLQVICLMNGFGVGQYMNTITLQHNQLPSGTQTSIPVVLSISSRPWFLSLVSNITLELPAADSVDISVPFNNAGTETLSVTSMAFSGDITAIFSTPTMNIGSGADGTLSIPFVGSAYAPGLYCGNLTIQYNSVFVATVPYSINIVSAGLLIQDSVISRGFVFGAAEAAVEFTILNDGTANLFADLSFLPVVPWAIFNFTQVGVLPGESVLMGLLLKPFLCAESSFQQTVIVIQHNAAARTGAPTTNITLQLRVVSSQVLTPSIVIAPIYGQTVSQDSYIRIAASVAHSLTVTQLSIVGSGIDSGTGVVPVNVLIGPSQASNIGFTFHYATIVPGSYDGSIVVTYYQDTSSAQLLNVTVPYSVDLLAPRMSFSELSVSVEAIYPQSTTYALFITNTGTLDLHITFPLLPSWLSFSDSNVLSQPIAPSQRLEVTLIFTSVGKSISQYLAFVPFNSDAYPPSSQLVTVMFMINGPLCLLQGPMLSGNQANQTFGFGPNQTAPLVFYLQNGGTLDLVVSGLQVIDVSTGMTASWLVPSYSCSGTIVPGQSSPCALRWQSYGSSTLLSGVYTASVTVFHNGPVVNSNSTFIAQLTIVPREIATFSFPNITQSISIHTASDITFSTTVPIINSGDLPFTILSWTLLSSQPQLVVTFDNGLNGVVLPFTSTTMRFRFTFDPMKPSVTPFTGSITIHHNDGSGLSTFWYSFTLLVPLLTVSPPSIVQYSRYQSLMIDSELLTISNNGTAPLHVTVTISSTGGGDVSWLSFDSSVTSFTLMPSNIQLIPITFDPSMLPLGNAMASMVLTHDGPYIGSVTTIPITFTIQAPSLELIVDPLINKTAQFGSPISRSSVVLTNTGILPLLIEAVAIDPTTGWWLSTTFAPSAPPLALQSGDRLTVYINYDSSTLGLETYTTALTIQHDAPIPDSVSTVVIALTMRHDVEVQPDQPVLDAINTLTTTSLSVRNTNTDNGAGLMNVSVISIAPSLTLTPRTMLLAASAEQICTLTFDRSGLTPGVWFAVLTLSYSSVTFSATEDITVQATVYAAPDPPSTMSFAIVNPEALSVWWPASYIDFPLPLQPISSYGLDMRIAGLPPTEPMGVFHAVYNGTATSAMVAVAPFTAYEFRIRAANAVGLSAYSAVVSVNSGRSVPLPVVFELGSVSGTSITVMFNAMALLVGQNSSASVDEYAIDVSSDEGATWPYSELVAAGTSSVYNVSTLSLFGPLVPGVDYRVRVRAHNGEGWGIGNSLAVTTPSCGAINGNDDVCSGHGQCFLDPLFQDGQICDCDSQYFGPLCQYSCPSDNEVSCSGHGQCQSDGTCACDSGFVGPTCTSCPVDTLNVPCGGHGTCMYNQSSSTATCQCSSMYRGASCSVVCPACSSHGQCAYDAVMDQTTCSCSMGYRGATCLDMCPSACSAQGTCLDNNTCICLPTTIGPYCQYKCPVNSATGEICSNMGTCLLSQSTAICNCSFGTVGPACEQLCPGIVSSLDPLGNTIIVDVCSGLGQCYGNSTTSSCVCEDEDMGFDCSQQVVAPAPPNYLPISLSLKVSFVWGLSGVDMSHVDRNDPDSVGVPIFDPFFDFSDVSAQLYLESMCFYLVHNMTDYIRPDQDCIFTDFAAWSSWMLGRWPLPPYNMTSAMWQFLSSTTGASYKFLPLCFHLLKLMCRSRVGFADNKVAWIRQELITYVDKEAGAVQLKKHYDYLENFMKKRNALAPPTCNDGFQSAYEYAFMIVQLAFISGVAWSLVISLVTAFLSLIAVTGNMWLSLWATLCLLGIILCMLGFFVLVGWTIGAVEAISLSIIVGLSVDYTLHLGHSYNHVPKKDRYGKTRVSLAEIGSSVLAGAITTAGAMIPLFFCIIQVFVVIGVIVSVTIGLSIYFSLGLFSAILTAIGPEGRSGKITVYYRWCKYQLGWITLAELEQEDASDHEPPPSPSPQPMEMQLVALAEEHKFSDISRPSQSPRNSKDLLLGGGEKKTFEPPELSLGLAMTKSSAAKPAYQRLDEL